MESVKPEVSIDYRSLQICDIPAEDKTIHPFTLVIFGGAGDLSQRKLLPTLCHLFENKELIDELSVIGVGRMALDDLSYRKLVGEALKKFSEEAVSDEAWINFSRHIYFLSMDAREDNGYEELRKKIDTLTAADRTGKKNIIFYMAVPPELMPEIVRKLGNHGFSGEKFATKILAEKPFGRDRASAVLLNSLLLETFNENQIYRIDHYLAKETVQNLIFFRFSNNIFEPLWNRRYIDNVQITVAESIGIEHRGAFYEEAGVVRDIVQNHIMQIIAMVAMEPPVGFKADYVRDERSKVFRSFRPMDASYIDAFTVRGQYGEGIVDGKRVPAYREEERVAGDSITPTFMAARLYIDNWRWADVPFYVRTGKRLAQKLTKVVVQFRQPPLRLFGSAGDILEPNILTIAIQPEEEISFRIGLKYPHEHNKIFNAELKFNYGQIFKVKPQPAYERLLLDCMRGDQTLFAREDGIEAMWEIVDPIIERWEKKPHTNFPNYGAGTWGPDEAERLLEKQGHRWHTL
jgi:glucose-6-phosphate 1-dehydrogenase